jgi:cytidine deaminase
MKDLYEHAKAVLPHSYSKYSNFKVAAALRMKDGSIITGVNVENASFGLSNCAERTALFTAYTKGYRKEDIKEILVTTEKEYLISPCGACRQVMSELLEGDTPVHLVTAKGDVTTLRNKELLPLAFDESDL